MLDHEVLRGEIDRSRAEQGGRWRCPGELRQRLTAHIRERRGEGVSLERIATDLGVCEASVSRWVSPVATTGKRELIEVAMTSGVRAQGLVVVTPRGYRLEGVSEGLALRLLREL
jgi:hypothetical protein